MTLKRVWRRVGSQNITWPCSPAMLLDPAIYVFFSVAGACVNVIEWSKWSRTTFCQIHWLLGIAGITWSIGNKLGKFVRHVIPYPLSFRASDCLAGTSHTHLQSRSPSSTIIISWFPVTDPLICCAHFPIPSICLSTASLCEYLWLLSSTISRTSQYGEELVAQGTYLQSLSTPVQGCQSL